ncbi:hypothetical protein FHX81_7781 [Saccharothrix saharensis]|uniref:Uncharacterized protein n=1 Tax=Saccharothrix saharensis TaxID=571190 RepID=A0A543JR35_9PSEU|nr:DUF5980 family protein [Saccharothrix saharensis]TQM85302.1 hypothetical protein FHX81_7781 [Saccharothrix saharensis]
MRAILRSVRSALTFTAALLLPLVGSSAVASAQVDPRAHTWHLEDFGDAQRMCVHYSPDRVHGSYFLFAVTGAWSTNLRFGVHGLPPGWTATEGHLAPGSNHPDPDDGSFRINGGMSVSGPASVPIDVYDGKIWVSDGVVTETTAVEIVVTTASWLECMQARD